MKCPTCGQNLTRFEGGEELARRMSAGNLGCYQGQDGNYYLERGAGEVNRYAIDDAIGKGLIVPRWDDAPHLAYWRHNRPTQER